MKKTLSLILALIMVAAMFAVITVPASAAEAATPSDVWDGTADTTWYDATKTEFTLTTAEQLAGLAKLVNEAAKAADGTAAKNFDGVTIKLGADMILNEGTFTLDADKKTPLYNGAAVTDAVKAWTPIGEASNDGNSASLKANSFWGNFDGQGHTISGIYINQPEAQQMGLFAKFSGKEFKNVKITNSYVCGDSRMGSLIGFVFNGNTADRDILIENVSSSAIVVADAANKDIRSGGMIGMFRQCENVTVKGMEFTGVMSGFGGDASTNAMLIGGLVGIVCGEDSAESFTFENCKVNAALYITNTLKATNEGQRRIGGLMGGGFKFYGSFTNCEVNITDTNITEENGFTETTMLAALVGYYENVGEWTFTDCSFNHIGAIKVGLGGFSEDTCKVNGLNKAEWAAYNGMMDIFGATNHVAKPESFSQAVPPTCTQDGTISYAACEICGAMVNKDLQGVASLKDPAACTLGELVKGTPATCTEAGTVDHYKCSVCNKLYDADKNEITSIETPAAHTLGEWVEAVEATTEKAGVLGHYQCSVCNKYFDKDEKELASIEGAPKLTTPVTTTEKPAGNDAPATTEPEKKGCGGFTAVGALLALVALTGTAIVIKKK